MKSLYESLLDIDNIETDANVIKYLSPKEFRNLYKRKLKLINIDEDNQICIIEGDNLMTGLCKDFNAKNISIKGIYSEVKIKLLTGFAFNCKNLIDFQGPNAHENYSDIDSLEWFFRSDIKLKTFDLSGIAKSAKNIKYISSMFEDCNSLEVIDLGYFDFSELKTCDRVFANCEKLKRINLGNSNAIINADEICWFNTNLEEFNAPNMILSGRGMFYACDSLKHINAKYIDVSKYYNTFLGCDKLENVNIFGLGKNTKHDFDYIDISWAISLNDKSWDFLFKNMRDGGNTRILLPDIPQKEKLIKKYSSITKKHNFRLI